MTVLMTFLYTSVFAESRSLVKPLLYPTETIRNDKPYFIWKDIYGHKDGKGAKYRITLNKEDSKTQHPLIFLTEPILFFREFYSAKLPVSLENSSYSYTIERMFNNRPVNSRYYSYLNYPITGSFNVDKEMQDKVDYLPPEYLIMYKYTDKENTLNNGYNFLFYTASSTVSLGIGYLFYSVLHFGMISTVITLLCVISAAVGYPAAGYYGYSYMSKKSMMDDILKTGSRVRIKGSADNKGINTEVELRF